MNLKKAALAGLLVVAGALLAAQAVSLQRSNPPVSGDVGAPPKVEALLRHACYDCHSNETKWPWYSRVAPVSWIIVHDVDLGRKEVNFSQWHSYYPLTRRRKLQWMGRALREEAMPPRAYCLMHPEARLGKGDRAMLERWIESAIVAAPPTGANRQYQK